MDDWSSSFHSSLHYPNNVEAGNKHSIHSRVKYTIHTRANILTGTKTYISCKPSLLRYIQGSLSAHSAPILHPHQRCQPCRQLPEYLACQAPPPVSLHGEVSRPGQPRSDAHPGPGQRWRHRGAHVQCLYDGWFVPL